MASPLTDRIDKKAREKSIEILRRKFGELARNIMEGKKPVLILPKRVLTNTIYDVRRKLLLLGPEMKRRSLLDMNEARKFMQTLLMASIIYEALRNDEYPTIRDLYYRGKHTITFRDPKGRLHHENTWDEQRESDSVIRDIEVFLGLLREEMLILSKEKGKVVGNLVIKSGDDVIDLSRMGHGAYAIEPTPDLIEFKDVDAEFVLVVEKDAVFQQLHRYGFWKKYKAILVTSAGQPDRATRRFIRRLNDELELPIYILTDSIPRDEVVIIRDRTTGKIHIGPIEELIGSYFDPAKERERVEIPIDVASWNPETGKIEWRPIGYTYRHWIDDEILEIETEERGTVKVTKAHSLFVSRNGKIQVIPAKEIKPGDYILVAEKLPNPARGEAPKVIHAKDNLSSEALEEIESSGQLVITLTKSRNYIPNKIPLDKDASWTPGIHNAEDSTPHSRYINLGFNEKETNNVEKAGDGLEDKFGAKPHQIRRENKPGIRLWINSSIIHEPFKKENLPIQTRREHIPVEIVNSSRNIIISYLKGLIDDDGYFDENDDIVLSTRCPVFSKQLVNLLLMIGVKPSVTVNGEDIVIRIRKSSSRTPPDIYKYLAGEEASRIYEHKLKTEPTHKISTDIELKEVLIRPSDNSFQPFNSTQITISKLGLEMIKELAASLQSGYESLVKSDIALVRVKSIRPVRYEGYVYDFAVPKYNNFIGGYGIIYHNSDPYGWYIYSVFKIGSITLSYESERLATPQVKFLGVSMSDVFGDEDVKKYAKKLKEILGPEAAELVKLKPKKPYLTEKERRNYIIRAKTKDIERAIELVGYDIAYRLITNPDIRAKIRGKEGIAGYPWFRTIDWIREISIFFDKLAKLEIEAMASKGLRFLADDYIPTKIETGDWID